MADISMVEDWPQALAPKDWSDARFHTVINQLPYKIAIKDASLRYVCCNRRFAAALGCHPSELIGTSDFDQYPQALAERYRANDRQVLRQKTELIFEEPDRIGDDTFWMHTTKTPIFDASGRVAGISVVLRDITQQKQAEAELVRRAWALQALRHSDKAMMQAGTEEELMQAVCHAIVTEGEYRLAWMGWAVHDAAKSIDIVAAAGEARDYLRRFRISWAETAEGKGPAGASLRLGRSVLDNDVVHSADFQPWKKAALYHEIGASLALPFTVQGRAAVLMVYAVQAGAFAQIEVSLFEELAANLAFVMESRRLRNAYEEAQQARLRQADQLEKALKDALAAIAAVLEQRDPYTAGHQERVAALAVLIGRELGLEEERLRVLHLAGVVHDLGKIQVPAEILSKPARLTEVEFALVKQHPQVGYELLRKIDFPWPIADIVHQHHEYLDGSGYPQGLQGHQILLEARILTVADIVESMSSDRPYRPALEMDEAVREITRQRGTRLDAHVVDACVEVLKKGFFTPHFFGE